MSKSNDFGDGTWDVPWFYHEKSASEIAEPCVLQSLCLKRTSFRNEGLDPRLFASADPAVGSRPDYLLMAYIQYAGDYLIASVQSDIDRITISSVIQGLPPSIISLEPTKRQTLQVFHQYTLNAKTTHRQTFPLISSTHRRTHKPNITQHQSSLQISSFFH